MRSASFYPFLFLLYLHRPNTLHNLIFYHHFTLFIYSYTRTRNLIFYISIFISTSSFSKYISKFFSSKICFASSNVFPLISGTCTWFTTVSSSSSNTSLFTSKYGNISLNICPPTGAATPPPCIMPHLLQSIF